MSADAGPLRMWASRDGSRLPDEFIQPFHLPGATGSVQITEGLVFDAVHFEGDASISISHPALQRFAGPRATVRRHQAERIVITNDLSGNFGTGSQYEREYRRSGNRFILERTELKVTRHDGGATQATSRMVENIQFVRLREDRRKDERRRQARSEAYHEGSGFEVQFGDPHCPIIMMEGPCFPGGDPTKPADPEPPSCPLVYGGANVLYRHGIMSSGQRWWRMEGWMRCTFQIGTSMRPSLNWKAGIRTQRDQLRDELPSSPLPLILIGHSNGGLVTRSFAQWAQGAAPGMVQGVVTIDSPNHGAVIAVYAQVLEGVIGNLLVGGLWNYLDVMTWHPFYEDDVPLSPFLVATNAFSETFIRVGIQTHTPKRWVAWRIMGTSDDCLPESDCGERAVARRTQASYDELKHCAKAWYRIWSSVPCGVGMLGMNALDAGWNLLTAPAMTTDGFIHGPGQVYPGAQRNELIVGGDSHVGSTRSPFVRERLEGILSTNFGVPLVNQ